MRAPRTLLALGLVLLTAATVRAQSEQDPAAPGKYTVSKNVVHVTVGDDTSLDVVQPADAPKGPAPTIVVVPGLGCQPEDYMSMTAWLVSHGFNVALFKYKGNESDKARDWDAALEKVTDQLQKDDEDPKSALHDKVDFDRLGIVGHSLGGAVATLAAARDSRFKALAVFGPAAIDQTFLDDARKVKGATIAIDAGLDRIAPPDKFGAVIVQRADTKNKAQIVVKDGAHPNSPADFNADYIRDTPRVVFKPNPAFFFMPTPQVEVPIVEGIKPIDGKVQRAIGFPFLTAWMEQFVAGVKDTFGYVDGTKGEEQTAAGLLDSARFTVAPDAAAAKAGKPADIRKTPRPKSVGLINALDRDSEGAKDLDR
jgi:dienelactone hydrolase